MKFSEKTFKNWFDKDSNIAIRTIYKSNKKILVCFIDCLVDKKLVSNNIISPILKMKNQPSANAIYNQLSTYDATIIADKKQAVYDILSGCVILFVDGQEKAICCNDGIF